MLAELDREEIKGLAEGYKSGDMEDLPTVTECIRSIADQNPTVMQYAETTIGRLRYIKTTQTHDTKHSNP